MHLKGKPHFSRKENRCLLGNSVFLVGVLLDPVGGGLWIGIIEALVRYRVVNIPIFRELD